MTLHHVVTRLIEGMNLMIAIWSRRKNIRGEVRISISVQESAVGKDNSLNFEGI